MTEGLPAAARRLVERLRPGLAWLPATSRRTEKASGLWPVFWKELADHLSSYRFIILFGLVAVTGLSSIYVAAQTIREAVGQGSGVDFVFLRLFTASGESLPPFTAFVGFLGPLIGLALGFDAINAEQARGTLSRVLAQPIHRDDLINGKFLAGIFIIAVMLFSLGLLVAGLGLRLIGVPPTGEETLRLLLFFAVTIVYVAFWLSLSILFSILFRQTATSALAGVAAWLFFSIFAGLLAGLAADVIAPVSQGSTSAEVLANEHIKQALARLSPATLYGEAIATLLTPGVRTLGPVLLEQIQGAIPGSLPLGQSLLLVWPHLTGLVAGTLIIFAVSYVRFMRQEIRA